MLAFLTAYLGTNMKKNISLKGRAYMTVYLIKNVLSKVSFKALYNNCVIKSLPKKKQRHSYLLALLNLFSSKTCAIIKHALHKITFFDVSK